MSSSNDRTRFASVDEKSLKDGNLSFLLEDVDRSAYEKALQYIQPLSELEDIFEELPAVQASIRQVINRVNGALTSDPDPILNALGLDNDQKELVEACTSAEVLKLSLLNAFDAIRQLLITDFTKMPKIYEDEAIELRVIPSTTVPRRAEIREPRRVPFSVVSGITDLAVHWQDVDNMIVGPDRDSGRVYEIDWTLPGTSLTIPMRNVPAGKIYLVSREEGDPSPLDPTQKSRILRTPLTSKGNLTRKLGDLSTDVSRRKTFDLDDVVLKNLRVPTPAMGFVESIYRAIRARPPVNPPNLNPADLSTQLKDLTLEKFRDYFRELVQRTTTATGDITTYDVADTMFFGGLAWVSSLLGITRPTAPPAPGPAGGPGGDPGGGGGPAPGGGPGGGGGGGGGRQHSLRNVLSNPTIAIGATPAERAANLRTLTRLLNQDELRQTLNRLTAGNVVFTEGTVDRWCELAGIKENR